MKTTLTYTNVYLDNTTYNTNQNLYKEGNSYKLTLSQKKARSVYCLECH